MFHTEQYFLWLEIVPFLVKCAPSFLIGCQANYVEVFTNGRRLGTHWLSRKWWYFLNQSIGQATMWFLLHNFQGHCKLPTSIAVWWARTLRKRFPDESWMKPALTKWKRTRIEHIFIKINRGIQSKYLRTRQQYVYHTHDVIWRNTNPNYWAKCIVTATKTAHKLTIHCTLLDTEISLCHYDRFRTFYNIYLLSLTPVLTRWSRTDCFALVVSWYERNSYVFQAEQKYRLSRSIAAVWRYCKKETNSQLS